MSNAHRDRRDDEHHVVERVAEVRPAGRGVHAEVLDPLGLGSVVADVGGQGQLQPDAHDRQARDERVVDRDVPERAVRVELEQARELPLEDARHCGRIGLGAVEAETLAHGQDVVASAKLGQTTLGVGRQRNVRLLAPRRMVDDRLPDRLPARSQSRGRQAETG